MPGAFQIIVVLGFVVTVALLAVLVMRRDGAGEAAVRQQLGELRGRLDAVAAAQTALPAAVAEGARAQLGVLGDVRDRLGDLQATTRQLEQLGRSVGEVERLLQVPKLRGTIGERWLEQLLSDVMPEGSFASQYAFRSGERVDAVIKVGGRLVPVDAKFPLEAYRRVATATTDDDRERERRALLRSVRARVDEIADKYIRPDEGTFDFALMYVPAEGVYYDAVVRESDGDAGVLAYALQRRVIPVSPHTFHAYLTVVLHGLKGLEVEARAREILDGLGALRQQFDALWGAYEKVGAHLRNAARQYDETERLRGGVAQGFDRLGRSGGA